MSWRTRSDGLHSGSATSWKSRPRSGLCDRSSDLSISCDVNELSRREFSGTSQGFYYIIIIIKSRVILNSHFTVISQAN